MSRLTIDPDDPTPPFEQLRRQLVQLIDTGQLPPEARLPSVRQLAADLGLANGTVARTYQELEAAGYLRTRRGAGTRVAPRPPTPAREEQLSGLVDGFVRQARSLGYSPDAIVASVRQALRQPG